MPVVSQERKLLSKTLVVLAQEQGEGAAEESEPGLCSGGCPHDAYPRTWGTTPKELPKLGLTELLP